MFKMYVEIDDHCKECFLSDFVTRADPCGNLLINSMRCRRASLHAALHRIEAAKQSSNTQSFQM